MTPALRTPWPSVFFIYVCGIGAGMQFAKTSVVYDTLAQHYAAGPALAGWFVSAVGIVGVLFGATAGLIVARIGARPALLGALFAGAAISLIEATLPPVPVFLGLRGIEGAAHLAIVVAAPTLMTGLAAPRVRPLALGLWGTFMSVAFLVGGAVAGKIVAELGLGGVFLAHAALMAALAVAAFFIAPKADRPPPMRFAARALVNQHVEVYANTNTATPAWCFLCYTGMYVALQTLTPELAPETERHALIVGMAFVSVVATLVAGAFAARGASPFALTAGRVRRHADRQRHRLHRRRAWGVVRSGGDFPHGVLEFAARGDPADGPAPQRRRAGAGARLRRHRADRQHWLGAGSADLCFLRRGARTRRPIPPRRGALRCGRRPRGKRRPAAYPTALSPRNPVAST